VSYTPPIDLAASPKGTPSNAAGSLTLDPCRPFAASAEIHGAIVDLLPAAVRDRIVEHVKSDLVKVEPAKLVSRFRSLQQV